MIAPMREVLMDETTPDRPSPDPAAQALAEHLRPALEALTGLLTLGEPVRVSIDALGRRAELLVGAVRADGSTRGPAATAFVPTPFQQDILDALEGKGLRTDALAAKVGDRSRLFRPEGLPELRQHGRVDHHPRVGYFRPDAPPPCLRPRDPPGE